jgi:hypothetical protein
MLPNVRVVEVPNTKVEVPDTGVEVLNTKVEETSVEGVCGSFPFKVSAT